MAGGNGELMAAVESLGIALGVAPVLDVDDPSGPPACHTPMRQGDEFVCRCGLRWSTAEDRPHCDWADGIRGS